MDKILIEHPDAGQTWIAPIALPAYEEKGWKSVEAPDPADAAAAPPASEGEPPSIDDLDNIVVDVEAAEEPGATGAAPAPEEAADEPTPEESKPRRRTT